MSRWPVLAALAASLALVPGAACGSSGGGPTGPVGAPPPRVGAVEVAPPVGPVGTMFTLTATGLKEGEAVAFEITFPGVGKAFPGAALTVPADGIATTTYRATTANEPGEYVVRLTGPPGSLAEGRFRVSDGSPITAALSSDDTTGPSTSGRTGTTARPGRTTATSRGGSTTSTTARGSSTTATTRRSTTTSMTTATTAPATPTSR